VKLWVKVAPLAVTVMLKLPVGVPVTTSKFAVFEVPPPGEGLFTTTGRVAVDAKSLVPS